MRKPRGIDKGISPSREVHQRVCMKKVLSAQGLRRTPGKTFKPGRCCCLQRKDAEAQRRKEDGSSWGCHGRQRFGAWRGPFLSFVSASLRLCVFAFNPALTASFRVKEKFIEGVSTNPPTSGFRACFHFHEYALEEWQQSEVSGEGQSRPPSLCRQPTFCSRCLLFCPGCWAFGNLC